MSNKFVGLKDNQDYKMKKIGLLYRSRKMRIQKKIMLIVIFCYLLFLGCAQFPTSFNWVESDRIRVLDFIYEPAEAAPGDTVTLFAVFAGDSIKPLDVQWNVSYKLGGNSFNLEIADSIVPLVYSPVDTTFSQNTFTVAIQFRIPDDVMEKIENQS